jgi:arylsulfatase A-like enzyme
MQCGFEHHYGFMSAEIDYFKHTNQRRGVDWQRDGKTLNEEGYSTYLLADEAVRQLKQPDERRPFFMEVAFNAPHVPLAAPDELVAKNRAGGVYAAVLEAMDVAIGRILAALDERGLREDTLVVFCSDNGASRRNSSNSPLSFGKDTIYEGGIRTPAVIRWPGHVPTGAATQQPVSMQDLFPTLASAAGVPMPVAAKPDGRDQWPALRDGTLVPREPFLIASHDTALVDGDWKLVEWNGGKRSLFNLRADVSETKDRLADESVVAARLTAKLAELKQGLPAAPAPRGAGGLPEKAGKKKGPPRGGGPKQ